MLKVNNISVQLGEKQIFNDINFKVEAGQIVCLLGANGAGKSTLLKALCGDLEVNGNIEIDNEDITNFGLTKLAKIRAVMPQKVNLNFAFTCLEVVKMGRFIHNSVLTENDLEIVETCMQLCGVWEFKHRRYPYLSGGEQQRVQLARVLAQIYIINNESNKTLPPRLLLLDECTSSLDPKYQHQVYKILQTLRDQNIAILSVVHDINLASQYADRILLLSNGALIEDASVHVAINAKRMNQTYDLHAQVIHHQSVNRPVVIALDQV